jgi:TatA/E family protein of Tat protein translocase
VRAVYGARRDGELYLCRHCADRFWSALCAQGWTIRPVGEHVPAPLPAQHQDQPGRTTVIGGLFDSPWKILIVAVVLIVLFGSKKLPDAARSLGRSMRILKSEVSSLHEDDPELPPQHPR